MSRTIDELIAELPPERQAAVKAKSQQLAIEMLAGAEAQNYITFDRLVDAIEHATKRMYVCVPSDDYYRRSGDWSTDSIQYVDPQLLIQILKGDIE